MTAPLGYGQELFWQLDNATPGLIAYNVPRAFRVRGALDDAALEGAFNALADRHRVLRSVYALEGDRPVQRVLPDALIPFERASIAERDIAEAVATRSAYHFDLTTEVPLRASLLSIASDDNVLFFLTHHIVSDGWSKSIIFRELGELYAAFTAKTAPQLAVLPLQFGDYARRERAAVAGGLASETVAYWREQLRGPLPVLQLPTDFARPARHTFDGDVREATLPAALVDGLRALGLAHGASLYMVLLAAYQTLLHRYTEQDDIITGSPTAGRETDEAQGLVGYFAGALVMRNSLAGNPSFRDLLESVANTALDAYEHQDIPFELLVHEVRHGEHLTHAPLFQCVLTMEDTIPAALVLGDARLEPLEASVPATKFDLTLLFSEHEGGLRLRLQYRTALFTAARIERMLGHLRTLLEAAIADPTAGIDQLALLSAKERQELLVDWNDTAWDEGAATTVVAMAERHAARIPARTAVVAEDGSITWGALDARANQLAGWLLANGSGRGSAVGVCLDRSTDLIIAMLGVLKSGAAFVALLPDLPPARLAEQMRASGVRTILTRSAFAGRLPATAAQLLLDGDGELLDALPCDNAGALPDPESLAYVLFTSGSTGAPKGVAVTHANIAHYTRAIARRLGFDLAGGTEWHFATASTLGADLGHTAVFPALCSGGTLHIVSSADATDPSRFSAYVREHPIDVLKITPNHYRALTGGAVTETMPREWLVFGGETCPWDLVESLAARGPGRVLNHYGPTETTVGVSTFEVLASQRRALSATVPIGRPLANTTAYVLDRNGELVPIGVPGELYIGGAGVAHGYIGRDDLTQERFVLNPLPEREDERVYRTGDRVRWLESGDLEFLGRADEQIKVRGYRVEPGEIEHVLRAHAGVAGAAVILHDAGGGEPTLTAYVVPRDAEDAVSHLDRATAARLTEWMKARLPGYMVPAAVVMLDALPLTPNGKLDRAALPAPGAARWDSDSLVAPATATERRLAAVWAEVLKKERIWATHNFLDLGGHSLLAIQVLGKIRKQFGVRLPLRALFDAPTLRELAAAVDLAVAEKEGEDLRAALAQVEGLSNAEIVQQLASGNVGETG